MSDLAFLDQEIAARPDLERIEALMRYGIEHDAFWLQYHADNLARHSRGMKALPEFETKSEDALKKAELSLMEALNQVREAKKLFEECA